MYGGFWSRNWGLGNFLQEVTFIPIPKAVKKCWGVTRKEETWKLEKVIFMSSGGKFQLLFSKSHTTTPS